MKKITLKKTSEFLPDYNVYANGQQVASFHFFRGTGKWGANAKGTLTDTATGETSDLGGLSYFKDVKSYITEQYS
jgi:hypothetical protein